MKKRAAYLLLSPFEGLLLIESSRTSGFVPLPRVAAGVGSNLFSMKSLSNILRSSRSSHSSSLHPPSLPTTYLPNNQRHLSTLHPSFTPRLQPPSNTPRVGIALALPNTSQYGGGYSPSNWSRSLSGGRPQATALPAIEEATTQAQDLVLLAAAAEIQGTVQKVHYRDPQSGYTVLRLAVKAIEADGEASVSQGAAAPDQNASSSSKKSGGSSKTPRKSNKVHTVVGTFPQVIVGQSVKVYGSWTNHPQYGHQFRASDVEELAIDSDSDMRTYLASGGISGVGPVTADKMVAEYGDKIEAVLDSPNAVEQLLKCEGIGRKTAERIKSCWDAGKGAREGSRFLKDAGLPLAMAQRIAERYGPSTRPRVEKDPYTALAAFKVPLTRVDQVAVHLGAPADLVSRAAAALSFCLDASAQEGHSYLPWDVLEARCQKVLNDLAKQHGNSWSRPDLLHLVAKYMHSMGTLIIEPAEGLPSSSSTATEIQQQYTPSSSIHPAFSDENDLLAYLDDRIPVAKSSHLESMLKMFGSDVLKVLDAPKSHAESSLATCRGIGPKTAEKIKASWDDSKGPDAAEVTGGITLSQLVESPPSVPFAWSGDVRCYSPYMRLAEVTVASRIAKKASLAKPASKSRVTRIRDWIDANQEGADMALSHGQKKAIEAASDAPILVITGGPGCGKTTAVQTVVKLWCAQGKLVRICAPTGRAAQRLGVIQGIEPSTIHRMLKYTPRGGGSNSTSAAATASSSVDSSMDEADVESNWTAFAHNKKHPLEADAILLDEASMLSLPLAAALLDAIPPKAQLVLVGDVDQLPPIGPGTVLQSLIKAKVVPVVDLREIFRQAAESAIVTSAIAVRQGIAPELPIVNPTRDELLGHTSDAVVVRVPNPEDLPAYVCKVVAELQAASSGSNGEIDDLQVISPMKKGADGTSTLNPLLQSLLNPASPSKYEVVRTHHHQHSNSNQHDGAGSGSNTNQPRVFRVGDRVLQTVNNYDKDVFNGDQGRVVAAFPAQRLLHVEFPHLKDVVLSKDDKKEGVNESDVASPQGCIREYHGHELSQLELAYAVTVHKAQGGESRHVVLALSSRHGRMLSRRLLYTALTRAKERLIIVAAGDSEHDDPLVRGVRKEDGDVRLSWLENRLVEDAASYGIEATVEPEVFSNESAMLPSMHLDASSTTSSSSSSRSKSSSSKAALSDDPTTNTKAHNKEKDEEVDRLLASNLSTLSSIADELYLDEELVNELKRCEDLLKEAPLVDAESVRVSIEKLVAFSANESSTEATKTTGDMLRSVPRLLISSPEYVERGLAFASRLGPLNGTDNGSVRSVDKVQEESLVDQLRRLLGN